MGLMKPASRRSLLLLVAIAALVAASLGPATATASAAAASSTYYVDGKTGSDSNSGLTPSSAFRTIHHAGDAIPLGAAAAGWHVVVQGYTDYVYRERPISGGWNRAGAAGAPIVFEAAGYVPGGTGYVRPIVSGADAAPRAGKRWEATGTAGVWRTPWSVRPFGYGQHLNTAMFQDVTTWLWERPSLKDLASQAAHGKGGFVYTSGWIYVAPVGAAATSPGTHAFDVVTRNAFYFKGMLGANRVEVRGFEVRNSANGIAFVGGVDNSVVADDLLVGNLFMGVQIAGDRAASPVNPATNNTVSNSVFRANTLQGVKIDIGARNSTVCDNDIATSGLAGIKLQGAPPGVGNTLTTKGNLVCRNLLHDNTFNPTGSPYANTSGITLANGAQYNTITANRIYRNRVGIHVTQEGSGRLALTGNTLRANWISSNSRYGIYFYDGMFGSGGGKVVSTRDLVTGNGLGVRVDRGSTAKLLLLDTINGNRSDGIRVGLAGAKYASVSVQRTLITGNRGYGIDVRRGNRAYLGYAGIRGNRLGGAHGRITKKAVNTRPTGYLSTTSTDPTYLQISTTSYQYSAGPNGTPIGARW
jgi:hypothetical protein